MFKLSNAAINDLHSSSRFKMEKAFNLIYNEYVYLVFYIALKITKNNDVAEDITNETFMKFYENKNNIRNYNGIKYYLSNTSKNLSLNWLTSQKQLEPFKEEIYQEKQTRDYFQDYIDKFKDFLNEEEIDLIVLRFFYDFTFREISEDKNVSINIITSKYRRTLEKIKKHYQEK